MRKKNPSWSPAARAKRAATIAARRISREARAGVPVVYREGEVPPSLQLVSDLPKPRRVAVDDMKDRQDIVKGMLAYLLGAKR